MRRKPPTTSTTSSIALLLITVTLCSCSPANPSPPMTSPPAPPPSTTHPVPPPVTSPPPPVTSPPPPVTSPPASEPAGEPPAATWGNVGPANLGDSIEEVSQKLGLEFGPVDWLTSAGDCGITNAEGFDLALVVAVPGGVQSFVIADSRIPLVTGDQPVGVGDSLSDAAAAFPQWFTVDSYESLADGPRGVVVPPELNQQGWDSRGRAALFEAGPDEVIRQYRVGVSAYTLHVDYCTTPD